MKRSIKVGVAFDEFVATGTFTVVSAPGEVTATRDQSAPGITIVLAKS